MHIKRWGLIGGGILFLSVWMTLPLQARLGETMDAVQQRFGVPVKQLKPPGKSELIQNQYFNHDLLIYVTFYQQVSVVEHYLKLKSVPLHGEEPVITSMPVDLAMAILQANAEGSRWQQTGDTENDIRYTREDQKALALLLKQQGAPMELRICNIKFVEALSQQVPSK